MEKGDKEVDPVNAVSLEELKLMLARLKHLDRNFEVFGSSKHQYRSYPVSDAELEKLEAGLGVRLPEDYRQFLQAIGYGAGPYYGLASPEVILSELDYKKERCEHRFPDPRQPFPFTRAQAEECFKIMGEHRYAEYMTEFPTDGCIPICEEGCTYWTYLITAGDLARSMWSHCEDVYSEDEAGPFLDVWNLAPEPPGLIQSPFWEPGPEAALSPFSTFIDWYRAWIVRCLSNLDNQKPLQPESPGVEKSALDSWEIGLLIIKNILKRFGFRGKSR